MPEHQTTKAMLRKVIIVLILALAGGGLYGLYMYNKKPASLANKQADVEVAAADLLADFENDESKANEKYLGKIVAVKGIVELITDEGGKQKIHLSTGNPMSVIICELSPEAKGSVNGGDEVTIKGKCSGFLTDVILVESHIDKI